MRRASAISCSCVSRDTLPARRSQACVLSSSSTAGSSSSGVGSASSGAAGATTATGASSVARRRVGHDADAAGLDIFDQCFNRFRIVQVFVATQRFPQIIVCQKSLPPAPIPQTRQRLIHLCGHRALPSFMTPLALYYFSIQAIRFSCKRLLGCYQLSYPDDGLIRLRVVPTARSSYPGRIVCQRLPCSFPE